MPQMINLRRSLCCCCTILASGYILQDIQCGQILLQSYINIEVLTSSLHHSSLKPGIFENWKRLLSMGENHKSFHSKFTSKKKCALVKCYLQMTTFRFVEQKQKEKSCNIINMPIQTTLTWNVLKSADFIPEHMNNHQ